VCKVRRALKAMTKKDPTSLFSGRVENYIKYRPGYSLTLLELLRSSYGLTPESVIVDMGSGTGILTELFLKNGNPVFAIEPNDEMRSAAEKLLGSYPKFTSVGARAEASTLSAHSVDFVTVGQAFHWFDRPAAKVEFIRILKPDGWVVLAWNGARTDTPFLKDYDEFWRTTLKGARGTREEENDDVTTFFGGPVERLLLDGVHQDMDFEQFTGRVLSISMSVQPGEPGHEAFMGKVRRMFERHQVNSQVRISYDTELVIGQLK
jgi:ubiquinone/menaquinone biosynthesis C-methylase UbiE